MIKRFLGLFLLLAGAASGQITPNNPPNPLPNTLYTTPSNIGGTSTKVGATGTYVDATLFGVKADGTFSCSIGTTIGTPTVTDVATDYIFTSADVGKNIFITNDTCGAFSLSTTYILTNPATILSVQSAHSITVSGNVSQSCSTNNCAAFWWTTDDQAALNAAFTAATTIPFCTRLQLPAGNMAVSAPIQSTGACGTTALGQPGVETVTVAGMGMAATAIVPLPTFNAVNCTFAKGGCFFGIASAGGFSGPQFMDFQIFGLGQHTVTNGSGAIAVLCGVASLCSRLALTEWGGASGVIGLQTNGTGGGGAASLNNIQNFEFGNPGFQLSGVVVAANIQSMGNPTNLGAGAVVSTNSSFFSCNTGAAQCMLMSGSATWKSVLDVIDILGGTPFGVNVQGGGAEFDATNDTFQTIAGSTALKVAAGNTSHVNQSKFGALGVSVNNAGVFFDDAGNGFAGTITNTGTWFGDGSTSGTALAAANITPTSGFGTGCATAGQCVSAVTGASRLGQFTMTYGAAPASPQVVTIVFPTAFLVTPICSLTDVGGTNAFPTSIVTTTCTTSGASFTITNTPVGGNTEVLQVLARVP